jgi:hypothetical protein
MNKRVEEIPKLLILDDGAVVGREENKMIWAFKRKMLKSFLRRAADSLIVRPVRYIRFKSSIGPQQITTHLDVLSTMHNNAIIDNLQIAVQISEVPS